MFDTAETLGIAVIPQMPKSSDQIFLQFVQLLLVHSEIGIRGNKMHHLTKST
jgi:hypothetical protein